MRTGLSKFGAVLIGGLLLIGGLGVVQAVLGATPVVPHPSPSPTTLRGSVGIAAPTPPWTASSHVTSHAASAVPRLEASNLSFGEIAGVPTQGAAGETYDAALGELFVADAGCNVSPYLGGLGIVNATTFNDVATVYVWVPSVRSCVLPVYEPDFRYHVNERHGGLSGNRHGTILVGRAGRSRGHRLRLCEE